MHQGRGHTRRSSGERLSSKPISCGVDDIALLLKFILITRVYVVVSKTAPVEKQALLAFRDSWTDSIAVKWLRANWTEGSDPCDDNWFGVSCSCDELDRYYIDISCNDSTFLDHVLALTLTNYTQLGGVLVRDLRLLNNLTVLEIPRANLTGEIPDDLLDSWGALSYLNLEDNNLTGSLPHSLPRLSNLVAASLSKNNFSGTLPDTYCTDWSREGVVVNVDINDFLCGLLDKCERSMNVSLSSSVYRIGNMFLITTNTQPLKCCEHPIPVCDFNLNCGVNVTRYVGPNAVLSFNFTNFTTYDPARDINYTYKVLMVPIYGANTTLNAIDLRESLNEKYSQRTELLWSTFVEDAPLTIIPRASADDIAYIKNVTQPPDPYIPYCPVNISDGNITKFWGSNTFTGNYTYQGWNILGYVSPALSGVQFAIRIVAEDNSCPLRRGSVLSTNVQLILEGPTAQPVYNTANREIITTQTDTTTLSLSWYSWYDTTTVQCCWYWVQFFDVTELVAAGANCTSLVMGQVNLGVAENFVNVSNRVNITDLLYVGNRVEAYNATGLSLTIDRTYVGVVYGTNAIGMFNVTYLFTDYAQLVTAYPAQPVQIVKSEGFNNTALAVGLSVGLGVGLPLLLFAAYHYWRSKLEAERHRERERDRQRQEALYRLVHSLTSNQWDPALHKNGSVDVYGRCNEVAFVVTDLQDSTAASAANGSAFKEVQFIHDQVMREGIAEFNGYEVCTEGDSFQIAFLTVVNAVKWALETQRRLLEVDWSYKVLDLPSCNKVKLGNDVIFSGPRVRMGIHWARPGTFVLDTHPQTRTRSFHGPSWNLAKEVGDIGHGGQVLLTHYAWLRLRDNMHDGDFPEVFNLGLYKLAEWNSPVWLYEIRQQLGQRLPREFAALRKTTRVLAGLGYRIMPPVRTRQHAASSKRHRSVPFTITEEAGLDGGSSAAAGPMKCDDGPMKCDDEANNVDHGAGRAPAGAQLRQSSMMEPRHHIEGSDGVVLVVAAMEARLHMEDGMGVRGPLKLGKKSRLWVKPTDSPVPQWVLDKTYTVLAAVAQQFQGYIVEPDLGSGSVTLSFRTVHGALGFCHIAQFSLLITPWLPESAHTHRSGACGAVCCRCGGRSSAETVGLTVTAKDGRHLFKGPRVSMVVHHTRDVTCVEVDSGEWYEGVQYWQPRVEYIGEGLDFARCVSRVVHGGQVVLTQHAWGVIQRSVPSGVQVLCLGSHIIAEHLPDPVDLVEVLPMPLQLRTFPPLMSLRTVAPGYRDSPDANSNVAICFAKVSKPRIVLDALNMEDGFDDTKLRGTLTTYFLGILMLEQTVREHTAQYGGYECKSPEPGKFTLAFWELEHAVMCTAHIQRALLKLPWPEELLKWDTCQEEVDTTGRVIWRGLRLNAGITWGKPDSKKPLNTGRADYFGSVANMSARIMSVAQPGQVLLQGCPEVWSMGRPVSKEDHSVHGTSSDGVWLGDSWSSDDTVLLKAIGLVELKGFPGVQELLQVVMKGLEWRAFSQIDVASRAPSILQPMTQTFKKMMTKWDDDLQSNSATESTWNLSQLGGAISKSVTGVSPLSSLMSLRRGARRQAGVDAATQNTAFEASTHDSLLSVDTSEDTFMDTGEWQSSAAARLVRTISKKEASCSDLSEDDYASAQQLAELYVNRWQSRAGSSSTEASQSPSTTTRLTNRTRTSRQVGQDGNQLSFPDGVPEGHHSPSMNQIQNGDDRRHS